jgi:hypothetical protein
VDECSWGTLWVTWIEVIQVLFTGYCYGVVSSKASSELRPLLYIVYPRVLIIPDSFTSALWF